MTEQGNRETQEEVNVTQFRQHTLPIRLQQKKAHSGKGSGDYIGAFKLPIRRDLSSCYK